MRRHETLAWDACTQRVHAACCSPRACESETSRTPHTVTLHGASLLHRQRERELYTDNSTHTHTPVLQQKLAPRPPAAPRSASPEASRPRPLQPSRQKRQRSRVCSRPFCPPHSWACSKNWRAGPAAHAVARLRPPRTSARQGVPTLVAWLPAVHSVLDADMDWAPFTFSDRAAARAKVRGGGASEGPANKRRSK